MIIAQAETYPQMCRRKALAKARRFAPDGYWKIKSPKRVLRCDICQKYKKKQAAYVCWSSGQLLCEDHAHV